MNRASKNKVAEVLAKNIRKARKRKKLTAADVSARIGCATSTYLETESGRMEPRVSTLLRIAAALQIDWLLLTRGADGVPLPQGRRVIKS